MSVQRDQPDYSRTIRPFWYDRYPIQRSLAYFGVGVAPHGVTTRATYTVPPNRKAWVCFSEGTIVRATAPTAVGLVRILAQGADHECFRLIHIDAAALSYEQGRCYVGYMIPAGEQIILTTMDLSNGGTMDYAVFITVVEFDA